jgi:hypothetical protein
MPYEYVGYTYFKGMRRMARGGRRPGAGRKQIDPQGAAIVPVRFTQDDWEAINRAGKRFNLKGSQIIRTAVQYWLGWAQYPYLHVAWLTCLIAILIKRIEGRSGQKWIVDPETGAAVREEIGYLIGSLAPEAKEQHVASPEFRRITEHLITITVELCREPQSQLAPVLGEDDWATLALIARGLGPSLLRKMTAKVTIKEIPVARHKRRQKR